MPGSSAVAFRGFVVGSLLFTGLIGAGMSPATAAPVDPVGYNWTARTAPEANSWRSVAYGNGVFVAVSNNGTNRVMTSPDGVTWTARSAASSSWYSVTFGNGLFVATATSGTNQVMTSPDGITWTARTAAEATTWQAVTYGNERFVAVANFNGASQVMTSPDGITWTARIAAEAAAWQAVTYGNGLFVAVSPSGTNRVMTSPDGITWTARTVEASSWIGVTYGNGLFVAVANFGTNRVMTSPDGITWTPRTAGEASDWRSVTYGNGMFAAVAEVGTRRVMTSNDLFLTQNGNTLQVVPASGTAPVQYRVQYNTAERIAQGKPWAQWGYNWAGSPTTQALNSASNTFDIDLATYAAAGSCTAIGMPATHCPRQLGVLGAGESMRFRVRVAATPNGQLTDSPVATITRPS